MKLLFNSEKTKNDKSGILWFKEVTEEGLSEDEVEKIRRYQKIKNILRWIAVLPGSLIAGFLMTFPLHWILYLAFNYGGTTLFGFMELNQNDYILVEHTVTPFVIAPTFVLTGFEIAPKYKIQTSLVLTILWIISWISLFIFFSRQIELRGILSLLGSLLGLYIAWRKSKEETLS